MDNFYAVERTPLPPFDVSYREYDGLGMIWVPNTTEPSSSRWLLKTIFDPNVHEVSSTGILLEKVGGR